MAFGEKRMTESVTLKLRISELETYNKVISDKLAELQKQHAELKLKYEACERDFDGSFKPLPQLENLFKETYVNGKHWGLLFTSEIFNYAKYNRIIDAAIAQALARKLTCKLSEVHAEKLQNPDYKNTEYEIVLFIDSSKSKEEEQKTCNDCGLPISEHDESGFCPPGTEEFGGRR